MGIPPVGDWLDFMPDTVTIEPVVSVSVSGVPTYGAGVNYPAYIEMKNHQVVDKFGKVVVARGRVFLGTTTVPDVRSRLTIPSRFQPTQPPIISANAASDESGTHHITLEIG